MVGFFFEAMKGGQYLKKVGEVEAIGVWCGRWNGWQLVAETCKSAQDGAGLREMAEAMKGGQYLKKVGEVEVIGVWCGLWNGW